MPYRLEGHFIEACDCSTICPCWIDGDPDGGECTGLFVWEITRGSIEGIPVAGLNVASVSYHSGNRRDAKQRVVMFIDERASDDQHEVLTDVFSGQHGGTLGELGAMLGELVGTISTPIGVSWDDDGPSVDIGDSATLRSKTVLGETGRPITLVDGSLARTLGSPAQIGTSTKFELDVEEGDFSMSVRGRSVTHGLFNYAG